MRLLKYAKQYTNVTCEDIEIIMHSSKTLLFDLFMITQLVIAISFIFLYVGLLEQFLYGTLLTKVYNPPPQSGPSSVP